MHAFYAIGLWLLSFVPGLPWFLWQRYRDPARDDEPLTPGIGCPIALSSYWLFVAVLCSPWIIFFLLGADFGAALYWGFLTGAAIAVAGGICFLFLADAGLSPMVILRKSVAIANVVMGIPIALLSLVLSLVFSGANNHWKEPGLFLPVVCAGFSGVWGGLLLWKDRLQWRVLLALSGILWLISIGAIWGHDAPTQLYYFSALMANINLILVAIDLRTRQG